MLKLTEEHIAVVSKINGKDVKKAKGDTDACAIRCTILTDLLLDRCVPSAEYYTTIDFEFLLCPR